MIRPVNPMTHTDHQPGGHSGRHLELWEVVDQREVFAAPPWIYISRQRVRLPGGRVIDDYHYVRLTEFAVVFAETADGRVIVERQYKHGIGNVSLTLPAGMIEEHEDPLVAAQRELLEETGHAAENWHALGNYSVNSNYGCGRAHLFSARKATRIADPKSGDLEEMEILLLTPTQLAQAAHNGEVCSLSSIAAIALATNPLWTDNME
ncbi:MAG: NUDIX hydrolase [Planctomycetaceae bacterium]